MDKVRKVLSFEIKQVGPEEDRTLRFVGSDESVDRDNDVIEVVGWRLDDYLKNPVFLWAHQYDQPPVGKAVSVTIDAVSKKLMFDIKFPTAEEYPFADTIYKLYRGGYLSATSVGFRGIKYKTRDDDDVLELPEWRRGKRYIEQSLLELSSVPVPSNPNALQTAKSTGIDTDLVEKAFDPKKQMGDTCPHTCCVMCDRDPCEQRLECCQAMMMDCQHMCEECDQSCKMDCCSMCRSQEQTLCTACDKSECSMSMEMHGDKSQQMRSVKTKQFVMKKADLDGNPSVWDIMAAIRLTINPAGIYTSGGPWIDDLYPINYPSGSVVVEKSEKYFLYQYEYKDGVATMGTDFVELEAVYKPKGFEQKSGASLSRKNKELLDMICKDMGMCEDTLRKFIDTAGMMEDDPMMTANRTAQTGEIKGLTDLLGTLLSTQGEQKQALDDFKSQVLLLLSQKGTGGTDPLNPDASKADSSKDIGLEAIEFPKSQSNAAQVELNIEPGELKNMIAEIINQQLKGGRK